MTRTLNIVKRRRTAYALYCRLAFIAGAAASPSSHLKKVQFLVEFHSYPHAHGPLLGPRKQGESHRLDFCPNLFGAFSQKGVSSDVSSISPHFACIKTQPQASTESQTSSQPVPGLWHLSGMQAKRPYAKKDLRTTWAMDVYVSLGGLGHTLAHLNMNFRPPWSQLFKKLILSIPFSLK